MCKIMTAQLRNKFSTFAWRNEARRRQQTWPQQCLFFSTARIKQSGGISETPSYLQNFWTDIHLLEKSAWLAGIHAAATDSQLRQPTESQAVLSNLQLLLVLIILTTINIYYMYYYYYKWIKSACLEQGLQIGRTSLVEPVSSENECYTYYYYYTLLSLHYWFII